MIIQCIFDFLFAGCWLLLNPSPEGVLSWAFVLHRCVCVFICICYCKSISNCCCVSDCICCCPLLSPSPAWEVLFWVFVQLRGICLSVVFCTFQGQSTHLIPLIVSEKAKDTKAQPFFISSAAKYYLKIGESYIRLDGHRRRGKDTAKRWSEGSAATASLDEDLE